MAVRLLVDNAVVRAAVAISSVPLCVGLVLAAEASRVAADVTVIFAPAGSGGSPIASVVMPSEGCDQGIGSDAVARASPSSERELAADAQHAPAAVASVCSMPTPVRLIREGTEEQAEIPLTDCEGVADPASVAALSVLARPATLDTAPSPQELAAHAADPDWVAVGIRRLHPGLAERLRALADRFPGHPIEILAGYRPDAREGSRHLLGLALDVRVRGTSLDAVHRFVTRFDRTGVGLHRAAGFIHLDVRTRSLHWTDESAPGDEPEIVVVAERPRAPVVREAFPVEARSTLAASSMLGGASPSPRSMPASAAEGSVPLAGGPAAGTPIDLDSLDARAIADEIVRVLREVRIDVAPPDHTERSGHPPRGGCGCGPSPTRATAAQSALVR